MLAPSTTAELQAMVTSHDRVLAVGGRTKSRLSVVDDCEIISTQGLNGITEYEPSEYTFTALAGTPVKEIHAALESKGQFLPCSALLRDSGATLGGAIASGLSGPARFRFGGLRDFLLGVRFVAGDGKLISTGGKVVKNAAGFDLPKFMVGSLGRYGILTEVTFKVFPRPSRRITLKVQCASHQQALERIVLAASSRWELYAIDYGGNSKRLFVQLGGPSEAIVAISAEIHEKWGGDVEEFSPPEADEFWQGVRELHWAREKAGATKIAAKVPISPKLLPPLQDNLDQLNGVNTHHSVAGNVVVISTGESAKMHEVDEVLKNMGLQGMTFVGDGDVPLWLGKRHSSTIASSIKRALDPDDRFPAISE